MPDVSDEEFVKHVAVRNEENIGISPKNSKIKKHSHIGALQKNYSEKLRKIPMKAPALESLFSKVASCRHKCTNI